MEIMSVINPINPIIAIREKKKKLSNTFQKRKQLVYQFK